MKIDRYDIKITDNEYLIIDRLNNEVEARCYTRKIADQIANALNRNVSTNDYKYYKYRQA